MEPMNNYSLALILLLTSLGQPLVAQDVPLTVSIVSPPEGGRLAPGTEIEVLVNADADETVEAVELFINDSFVVRLTESPYVFTISDLPPSSVYRLQAVAETASGLTAIDSRIFSQFQSEGFAISVDLVTLYVTVNNPQGEYVRNLTADDFIIEEDGVEQKIENFSSEQTPLTLAMLMDISSSMLGERIVRSQNAAIDLIRRIIGEKDRATIMGFDDRLFTFQPLTDDVEKLVQAIRMTGPNGGTALYDAVAGAVRKLFPLRGKRAIVLLSDGDDTDSSFKDDEVLNYLQKSSVIVYTVGLQTLTVAQTAAGETRRTINNLRDMADFSGGRSYFPNAIGQLPGIYRAIGADLSSQYTISFYSTNGNRDGSWRELKVRIKGDPNLELRHRTGYYAN